MLSRKIYIVPLLALPLLADLSIGQMEMMVEKIKEKRVNILTRADINLTSPFVSMQRQGNNGAMVIAASPKSNKPVRFLMGAIVNDRAFLNGQWIKIGGKIEGFELVEIRDGAALLRKENREVKIFLKKRKSIIQVEEENI